MKKNIFKRLILYLAAGIGTLFLLAILFAFFLSIPPGEKILKSLIQDQISEFIQLETSIGHFETNLTSRIVFKNLDVYRDINEEDNNILTIDRLSVRYDIWKLLSKNIFINNITVDGLHLNLERSKDGLFDIAVLDSILSDTITSMETKSNYTLNLLSMNINDGNIQLKDHGLNLRSNISHIKSEIQKYENELYVFQLKIDSVSTAYDTVPALCSRVDISGRIDSNSVELDSIRARIDDISISGRLNASFDEPKSILASLMINGDLKPTLENYRSYFGLPDVEIKKDLAITCNVEGTIEEPRISLTANLPDFKGDELNLKSNRLVASYSDNTLSIDTFFTSLYNGHAMLRGRIVLDSIIITSASINLNTIDLAAVWGSIYGEKSPYRGKIDGQISIYGLGEDLIEYSTSADLKMRNLAFEQQVLPDVNIRASYENRNINFVAEHQLFKILADGIIKDETLNGKYNVNIDDIEPLAGLFNVMDLSGSLSASGDVSGNVNSPRITSEINLNQIDYQNVPIDTLYAIITYEDDNIYIEKASFEGKVTSSSPENTPFHIDSIFGSLFYKAEISGEIDNLYGNVTISGDSLIYSQYGIDSLRSSIRISGRNVLLDECEIYKDYLQASIGGSFDYIDFVGDLNIVLSQGEYSPALDSSLGGSISYIECGNISSKFAIHDNKNIDLDVSGDKIDLKPIAAIITDSTTIGGNLNFGLTFRGNFDQPLIQLNGRLAHPFFNDINLDSVVTQIHLMEDVLELGKLNIFGLGQLLKAEAVMELKPDTSRIYRITDDCRTSGRIFGENFDLEIINPFIPPEYEIKGNSTIELEWDGDISSPNIDGRLSLDSGYVFLGPDYQPIIDVTLRSTIKDSMLTINQLAGFIGQYPFDIGGDLLLSRDKYIKSNLVASFADYGNIRSTGIVSEKSLDQSVFIDSLNLSVFNSITPQISDLGGTAECHLVLHGSTDDPDINGKLNIRQLTFKQKHIPSKFENGVIIIQFNNDKINIDSIYTNIGGGYISINGNLTHDLARITNIDLYIYADNIRIAQPKEYLANVKSVKLRYTRQNENYLLDGDIELGETRLLYGFRPQAILPWARSIEQTEFELPELLMQTQMNIRIRESNNLWVDNNLAKLRLHAEVGVIGSPYKPNFSGRINVEEGYFLYLDRKFKIQNGDIYFYDPVEFNPEINILANTNVTSYQGMQAIPYRVTFSAEGLLEELKVGLYSEPPLGKSDIISLLTFGSTRSQLAGKDADTEAVLKERAQMLTSRRISSYLSRKTGSFLGLDEMTIEGNLFQFNRNGGPQVTAAKKISKRAKVTYSTTVGHLNDQSIRLDYLLTNRFSVMGQTDRMGRSSVDLKYAIRFK